MINRSLLFTLILSINGFLYAGQPKASLLTSDTYKNCLLEEFKLGEVQLLQLEVLNQFKESDEHGSSNASCLYHACRNLMLHAQAVVYPQDATQCFEQLVNTEHMAALLKPAKPLSDDHQSSPENTTSEEEEISPSTSHEDLSAYHAGEPMRTFIGRKILEGHRRKNKDYVNDTLFTDPNKTDSTQIELALPLLEYLKEQKMLGAHHIPDDFPLYYSVFENAAGLKPHEFKELLHEDIASMKKHLDAGEDVVGLIAVYYCDYKLSPRIPIDHAQSGKKLGHYTGLLVVSVDGKRQYISLDSGDVRGQFEKNEAVRDLVRYFESTDLNKPISLDGMEKIFSYEGGSHIYPGFVESFLTGSPRKKKEFDIRLAQQTSYAYYYAFGALCLYAASKYYTSQATKNIIKHPVIVS